MRRETVDIEFYGNLFSTEAEFVGDVTHATLDFDHELINRREGVAPYFVGGNDVDSNTMNSVWQVGHVGTRTVTGTAIASSLSPEQPTRAHIFGHGFEAV